MSSVRPTLRPTREQRGLRVTNWPLRDSPVRTTTVLFGCIAIAIGAGMASRSVSMGLLTGLVAVLVMWKLWIPITTEFEPRGVVLSACGRRRRISWRDIDHLELRGAGVFFCTGPDPADRAVLQSLFLPWGKDRDTIAAFCEEYRPLHISDWSGTTRISS